MGGDENTQSNINDYFLQKEKENIFFKENQKYLRQMHIKSMKM